MSHASKNLKYLRKLRGWTQEEFSSKLKIKRSLLGAYEEERADPKMEVMEIVCKMFKMTLDELVFNDVASAQGSSYLEKRRHLKMIVNQSEIQFVPMKAAAGYLAGYADPEFIDELNTFTLPMLTGSYYRAFEIIGDSMLPTQSGSVIVGEKVKDLEEVKNSNTYIVVSRNDGIVYKRVLKNNRVKNKVTLVSDNPLYEPYLINTDDIVEIWQAQMILSKANVQQRWDVSQLASLVNNLQEQVTTLKKKLN